MPMATGRLRLIDSMGLLCVRIGSRRDGGKCIAGETSGRMGYSHCRSFGLTIVLNQQSDAL